jgi:hypothetical protein
VDGREVRYGARCHHCSKEYSALSTCFLLGLWHCQPFV